MRTLSPLALAFSSTALAFASGCASTAGSDATRPATAGERSAAHVVRADYRVRLLEPAERAVEVEMRLGGLDPRANEIELALPDGYSFVRLEAPLLAAPLAARTPDGSALTITNPTPYGWKLATKGATDAVVTWTSALTAHDRTDVAERDSYGHPYVTTDHALLATGALMIAPRLGDAPIEYRVRFESAKDWPVLCPWREVEPGLFDPGSEQALQHDLVALGAWAKSTIRLDGMRIDVGIAPGQPALAPLAVPAIEKICAAELELFGVVPRPQYLFLFVAPKPVTGFSFAGSPKTGAMVLQVSGDLANPIAGRMIDHLVAHEFHHLWAVSRLDFGDDLRFVGEGFTDWYAHVVPARLALMPWPEFGEELGEKLEAWNALRPTLDAPLARCGGPEFFEGGPHYEATYGGGLLVAALLDLELRRAGRADGLDGWLREFVNDPRWDRRGQGPRVDDFLAHVESALGRETRERVSRWISTPKGFDPEAEFARLGVAVTRQPMPRTLRANFEGTRITALDRNSEAGRLGLREGDVIRGVNGRDVTDDASIQSAWRAPVDGQVVVRVERADGALELRAQAGDAVAKPFVDPAAWRTNAGRGESARVDADAR